MTRFAPAEVNHAASQVLYASVDQETGQLVGELDIGSKVEETYLSIAATKR